MLIYEPISSREMKLFLIIKEKSLNFCFNSSGVWMSTIRKNRTNSRFKHLLIFFQKSISFSVLVILRFLRNESLPAICLSSTIHTPSSPSHETLLLPTFFYCFFVPSQISSWGMFLRGCVTSKLLSGFRLVLHLLQE